MPPFEFSEQGGRPNFAAQHRMIFSTLESKGRSGPEFERNPTSKTDDGVDVPLPTKVDNVGPIENQTAVLRHNIQPIFVHGQHSNLGMSIENRWGLTVDKTNQLPFGLS